jgi:hypothetical protein
MFAIKTHTLQENFNEHLYFVIYIKSADNQQKETFIVVNMEKFTSQTRKWQVLRNYFIKMQGCVGFS